MRYDLPLFDAAFYVDPVQNVRATDPDTSRDAAHEHQAIRITDRMRARDASLEAGVDGLTDYQLGDRIGRQQNSAGKRRGELRDRGLVCDSGRRRSTPAGSSAIVWIAAEYCDRDAPHGRHAEDQPDDDDQDGDA